MCVIVETSSYDAVFEHLTYIGTYISAGCDNSTGLTIDTPPFAVLCLFLHLAVAACSGYTRVPSALLPLFGGIEMSVSGIKLQLNNAYVVALWNIGNLTPNLRLNYGNFSFGNHLSPKSKMF